MDQASMLAHIGLLNNKELPGTGIEQAKKKLQELYLLTKKDTEQNVKIKIYN